MLFRRDGKGAGDADKSTENDAEEAAGLSQPPPYRRIPPLPRGTSPPPTLLQLGRQRSLPAEVSPSESPEPFISRPFLELPAEIRNVIYGLVCQLRGLEASFMASSSCLLPPPISQTCRLVRAESLPFFYSNNVFQLSMTSAQQAMTLRLLALVSSHVEHLNDIRSMAPDEHNSSWTIRFRLSIKEDGKFITFTSQEPLTLMSQQTIVRVLLTSRAVHFRNKFDGRDLYMLFKMLRTGTARLEIDKAKTDHRNSEHSFDIRPLEGVPFNMDLERFGGSWRMN